MACEASTDSFSLPYSQQKMEEKEKKKKALEEK